MKENESIKRLTKLISAISNGRVEDIDAESESFASEWTDSEALKELQQEVLALARKHLQAKDFILSLSEGNLEVGAPRGNRLVDPFKELQANMRHLAWQTREIAQGDYSQKIDFLGDFSDSFNSLVSALVEKKKVEEALRESEFFFKESQRAAFIGSYKTDFIAGFWESSEILDQIFGIDKDYCRSVQGWLNIVHPDDLVMMGKYLTEEVIGKHQQFNKEYRIIRKNDGESRWVHGLGIIDFDAEGKVISLIGTIQDITDRKLAEDALIESEVRFRTLANSGQALIWTSGIDKKCNYFNKPWLDFTGRTIEQELGDGWAEGVHPDDLQQCFETYVTAFDRQVKFSMEYRVRHVSGEYRWIQDDGMPRFNSEGEFIGFIGHCLDITERKQAESALKENETRLRELIATKDKFFSIISHDLKSPFNSIIGLSNLLVEKIQEKNVEGIEEYADIIQKSAMQVFDLLMNLLEWSRSQTGRMEFSPEYVEMVTLINGLAELFADSARQKSITIFKELPRNMLIFADKAMISAILRNLISNAIKFTHPNGQIRISAELKKNELIIAVQDNGVGIKNDRIEKLFRIEETQSTVGTKNEKGTGLGLILCKEFIEKHGGKIWVESEVGKGSKFYFAIPKS